MVVAICTTKMCHDMQPVQKIGGRGGEAWTVKFSNFAYLFEKFSADNFCYKGVQLCMFKITC